MNAAIDQRSIVVIYILMATFNGQRFLPEQLDSILRQTLKNWVLLVRDDGSVDDTLLIINEYARRDSRIILINDEQGHLGPALCFGRLLHDAYQRGARYVACSDQDDIWLPEKLAAGLAALRVLEARFGEARPALVHSDSEVVDTRLRRLSPSFMHFQNIGNPTRPSLPVLIVQNHVVGCTLTANRALLSIALPIPPNVRMHDWWLALCAQACGTLDFLPIPYVRYRQHTGNALGAVSFHSIFFIFSKTWWARLMKRRRLHRALSAQTAHLIERMREKSSGNTIAEIEAISDCFTASRGLQRAEQAWRVGLRGQNWVTTLLFYFFLMLDRRTSPSPVRK